MRRVERLRRCCARIHCDQRVAAAPRGPRDSPRPRRSAQPRSRCRPAPGPRSPDPDRCCRRSPSRSPTAPTAGSAGCRRARRADFSQVVHLARIAAGDPVGRELELGEGRAPARCRTDRNRARGALLDRCDVARQASRSSLRLCLARAAAARTAGCRRARTPSAPPACRCARSTVNVVVVPSSARARHRDLAARRQRRAGADRIEHLAAGEAERRARSRRP